MPSPQNEILEALRRLVDLGNELYLAAVIELADPEHTKEVLALFEEAEEAPGAPRAPLVESDEAPATTKGTQRKQRLLERDYQRWYSEALPAVRQFLPERYDEFCQQYLPERRKTINAETYALSDFLGGMRPIEDAYGKPAFNYRALVTNKMSRQVQILASAEARVASVLGDIQRVVEAEVQDAQIDTARELRAAKHLRAAGVVTGVVLERHLKHLVALHSVSFRKKAQLGNLNDALKDAGVYDTPTWRRIQHLTDLRNLCGHDREREPTMQEIDDLIRGADQIVKTVF